MKYLKFYRYLLPFWKREVLVLFLSGITMALGLVNPYLTKLMIDKAYGNRDLRLFIILVAIGGGIFILNGLIDGLSNYLTNYIRLRINLDLHCKVFNKLQRLPYGFFQDSSTGEHLYTINYDIDRLTLFITDVLPQAIPLIPRSLLILAIVFYLDYKIALLALALIPFLYLAPYYFTRRTKKVLKKLIENSREIFKSLQEVLSHIHLVKALGKEKYETRRYIRGLIENIRFGLISTRLGVISGFANSSAQRIILGLIVFYGGYQIIKGKMTLGSLSAITLYLNQLSGLQSSLAYFFQQVSLGLVSCERLDSILETKLDSIEDKYTREIIFLNGRVEFRNVTFGYRQDKMVLQNLSFSIEGGSCIALVGPSGCGKTTIFNLILRLYKPLSGQIIIDGGNINLIKSKSLYAQIGVVLQEPYLWNDTVANNIKYGKPDASFKEVAEATKIACIDGFINNLPLGYDTIIGENACKISEGQKQRIAIARALIKRPKILILDEAMSSLDSETEDKVIDNIMRGFKDSTIIVVSHRLSAVRKMELIYFLKDASSIETGTHEELLEKTPQYRELFSSQIQALPRPALKERGLSENKILTSTK